MLIKNSQCAHEMCPFAEGCLSCFFFVFSFLFWSLFSPPFRYQFNIVFLQPSISPLLKLKHEQLMVNKFTSNLVFEKRKYFPRKCFNAFPLSDTIGEQIIFYNLNI